MTPGRRLSAHALIAAATLVAIVPSLGCGLMLYDVGELLFFVDAIRQGLTPGTDYAVNAYGPGRYVLLAGLFEVFGPSWRTVDLLFLAVRLLLSGLLWELGRRWLSSTAALLPVACVLLGPGPLHKGFYLLGTVALALALVRYLDSPSGRRAAALGVTLAGVAVFRLDLGIVGAGLAGLACVGRREPRHLVGALGPLALGGACVVGSLATLGDGALAAIAGAIGHQVSVTQGMNWPGIPAAAALRSSLDPWFLLLPLVAYPLLALRASAQPPPERRVTVLLLVLGVATLAQVRSKPEWGHLLQAGPLLWLACTIVLAASPRVLPRALLLVLPVALGVQALTTHRGSVYTGAFTICEDRTEPLATPLGPRRLNPGEHASLAPLLHHLATEAPAGPLWVPTYQPLLYALSGRASATGRVGVLFYGGDAARQAQMIAQLQARPPAVVVFREDAIEGPATSLEAFAPAVHAWMRAHYRLQRRIGDWEVLVKL